MCDQLDVQLSVNAVVVMFLLATGTHFDKSSREYVTNDQGNWFRRLQRYYDHILHPPAQPLPLLKIWPCLYIIKVAVLILCLPYCLGCKSKFLSQKWFREDSVLVGLELFLISQL